MAQPPPKPNPTFREQMAFVQWLMQIQSLTCLVYLRPDLGYRLLNIGHLLSVTGFVFILTVSVEPGHPDARPYDLLMFVLVSFCLGIYQRIKRWIAMNRGIHQDSYYAGTSLFSSWVAETFQRNRRAERFLDSTVCVLTGLVVFQFSRALGLWLLFGGLSIRSVEYSLRQRDRNFQMDVADSVIAAQRQLQIMEDIEQSMHARERQESPGINTGLGEDIEGQIIISLQHRKPKSNKPPIDI